MKSLITMPMPDGTRWAVSVQEVAVNRALHYKAEFGGDLERSLAEDTLPLFDEDDYEILDWAVNNMNWSDFSSAAKIEGPKTLTNADFTEAWSSAEKELC